MDRISQNNRKYWFIFAALCVLLMLSDSRLGSIRDYLSFIYSDYGNSQIEVGANVKGYFTLFGDVVEIRNRNEDLESENLRLKSELDAVNLKLNQLTQIKNSSVFVDSSKKYLKALMFIKEDEQNGILTEGSKNGVRVGDVVQFSQYYIGSIVKVDRGSSLVRLPVSRSSYIKVAIVKPLKLEGLTEKNLGENIKKQTKSLGVAVGKGDVVILENITVDKGVADGDLVIINDEKIGRYLILGRVVGLSDDPASSSLTSGIELPVIYDYINNYIVQINE